MLTTVEMADFLKVDSVTVQRELRAGRLPGRKVGRAWRASRDAILQHLTKGAAQVSNQRWHVHVTLVNDKPGELPMGGPRLAWLQCKGDVCTIDRKVYPDASPPLLVVPPQPGEEPAPDGA